MSACDDNQCHGSCRPICGGELLKFSHLIYQNESKSSMNLNLNNKTDNVYVRTGRTALWALKLLMRMEGVVAISFPSPHKTSTCATN